MEVWYKWVGVEIRGIKMPDSSARPLCTSCQDQWFAQSFVQCTMLCMTNVVMVQHKNVHIMV